MDAIIICGEKDEDIVQRCVDGLAMHVVDLRYIFVIAEKKLHLSNCVVFEEGLFPFTRDVVQAKTSTAAEAGRYLRELIRFYAPLLISGCSDTVLVIDADTILYKRVRFIENNKYLFDMKRELVQLNDMTLLNPNFLPYKPLTSGSVCHGVWAKEYLMEIMHKVETTLDVSFWEHYLDARLQKKEGGFDAYEVYWHYMMRNHADRVRIRVLRSSNYGQRWDLNTGDYQYISYPFQIQRESPKRLRI